MRCRWADLHGQALYGPAQDGQAAEVLGVAVTADHLGGGHGRGESQLGHDHLLQPGGQVGVGAHRAADLAPAGGHGGPLEAVAVAPELGVEPGQLDAEGDRLGVDAVAAAHLQGVLVLPGPFFQGAQQAVQGAQDQFAGLLELQGVGGVQHVGAGEPQVDEPAGGAHVFGHVGQEGDDVVLGLFFYLIHPGGVEIGLFHDLLQGLVGNAAQAVPGPAGGQLHLEPGPVAGAVGPDFAHFGQGVASDHGGSSSCDWCRPGLRPSCGQAAAKLRPGSGQVTVKFHSGSGRPRPGSS